ncbi:MAG: bifunctional folylpolyglutamate synthase/dihydrofolate synthase, partial [Lachnospiraceae bacterium]|nr:bifunctional folylpolyglutamate synthase/dihydrofolate synthase [Lachnospiraceae bacterium]
EIDKVIRNTFELASHIITVTPPAGDRALPALDLAQTAREYHSAVTAADCVQEAVEIAYLLTGKDKDAVIIAFGSLSYLGELMDIVAHRDKNSRDNKGRTD